ncbi:MAG: hypothetical protein ACR2QC_11970 [Gammaproteobacteria bacterium]
MKLYEIRIANVKKTHLDIAIDRFGWHDANIDWWNYNAGCTLTVKSNTNEIDRFDKMLNKPSRVKEIS